MYKVLLDSTCILKYYVVLTNFYNFLSILTCQRKHRYLVSGLESFCLRHSTTPPVTDMDSDGWTQSEEPSASVRFHHPKPHAYCAVCAQLTLTENVCQNKEAPQKHGLLLHSTERQRQKKEKEIHSFLKKETVLSRFCHKQHKKKNRITKLNICSSVVLWCFIIRKQSLVPVDHSTVKNDRE